MSDNTARRLSEEEVARLVWQELEKRCQQLGRDDCWLLLSWGLSQVSRLLDKYLARQEALGK